MPFPFYRLRLLGLSIFLSFALTSLFGTQLLFAQSGPPGKDRYQSEVQPELNRLDSELGRAECGGWHFETEVTEDTIGDATGLPGRPGRPFDHLESGMAWRQNEGGTSREPYPWSNSSPRDPEFNTANTGYEYPAGATGFMTSCKPGYPHFYSYHPCQRPGPEITGDGEKVYGDGNNQNSDPLGQGVTWTCDAVCEDMNRRWIFYRWINNFVVPPHIYTAPCFDTDTEAEPPPPSNQYVKFEPARYCCTQHLVGSDYPNCARCNGEECHQGKQVPNPHNPDFFLDWNYHSFYRNYQGQCTREPLDDLVEEGEDIVYAEPTMGVSCYDRYEPFDPKDVVSRFYHYRCVVDTTPQDRIPDLPETQRPNYEEVDYGHLSKEDELWPDIPSEDYHPRQERESEEDDIWYTKLSDNFSLIQNDPTPGIGTGDLTDHLFGLDQAAVRPYPALTLEIKRSTGGLVRAFDDTVRNEQNEPEEDWRGRRTLVEWWQELQTQMHTYLSPPQIRVVLPTTWSFGLDILRQLEVESTDRPDTHLQTVEMRLHSGEDTLGAIAQYFERSLMLRIQEEIVPILVPMGDVQDFKNASEQWCTYYKIKNKETDCEGASAEIKAFINGFADYAETIDGYRALRGELAYYQAALQDRQLEVVNTMANWLEQTVNAYREIRGDNEELENHRRDWGILEENMYDFTTEDNSPWCQDHGLTTSIYTFFDDGEWLPGRPALHGGIDEPYDEFNPDHLPRLPEVDKLQDIVLDFSLLVSNTGAIKLPVLQPIQIRIADNTFQPPSPLTEEPELPKPPPPIPNVRALVERLRDEVANNLPTVEVESQPPALADLLPDVATQNRTELQDKVNTLIHRVDDVIQRMRNAYRRFWDVVKRDPESITEGTEQDCLNVNSDRCIHNEMDLRERFVRMCARPGIILTKDLESIGTWRDPNKEIGDCPRDDWACQLERPIFEYDSQGWSLQGPQLEESGDYIDEARSEIVEELLLEPNRDPENRVDYLVKPELILPSFGIPPDSRLKP